MSKQSSNINTAGITNKGGVSIPKTRDQSDSSPVKVRSGARINKVSPGMNQQIVPLVPTES